MTSGNRHAITREAHRTEIAEDYVEVILNLIETSGEARLMDLVNHFEVAHPTAVKTLKRLQEEGLVEVAPRKGIHLTQSGRAIATASRTRHQTVVQFLEKLGLAKDQAEIDAEGIEHHVSPALLKLMRDFVV